MAGCVTTISRTEGKAPPSATILTALLAGMMIVSALPLNLLGVLAAVILPDLGMTRSEMGLALSLVTAVAGVLSLTAGRFTDTIGGRGMLRAAFLLGAAALGTVALAPSYGWLLVAMAIAGLMQSVSNPSTNWVIATHYPARSRGVATGIKQSGVQASLFLSGVALPPLAQVVGWRAAVATLIAIPLLGAGAATFILPRQGGRRDLLRAGRSRLKHPATIRWLAAYSLTSGVGQSSVLAFVPLYASEGIGMGLTAAGAAGATMGLLGVGSRIAWSARTERFGSMTKPLVIITCGSTLAAAGLLAAAELGPPAIWFAVIVGGGTLAASNAVVMLSTLVAAPAGTTGRASGLVVVFFLVGNTLGPATFGWLVDRSGSFRDGWILVVAAFGVALTLLGLWWHSERRP